MMISYSCIRGFMPNAHKTNLEWYLICSMKHKAYKLKFLGLLLLICNTVTTLPMYWLVRAEIFFDDIPFVISS